MHTIRPSSLTYTFAGPTQKKGGFTNTFGLLLASIPVVYKSIGK